MKRAAAIEALQRHADAIRARGVAALYLFGSTARDEARPDSDVDVLIDLAADARFSLINLVELKSALEEFLEAPADISMRSALRPKLKELVLRDAVKVF